MRDVGDGQTPASVALSLIIILYPNDIVFSEIIAKLYLDQNQRHVGTISQSVIRVGRKMNVATFSQLQFPVTTDNVGDALHYDPVFTAPGVALQTQTLTRCNFQPFHLKAGALFQHFISSPWSFVFFSHWISRLRSVD
jgi:hypothetical protein